MIKLKYLAVLLAIVLLISFNKSVAQPTLSAPTATAITNTTATLGGTVDTGTGITERGTVWNVGSTPGIGNNKQVEGGTTTGIFSHARTGLTPKSHIFYAPYAIDGVGTTIGPDASFYTLANEPGIIATFTSGAQTSTSIDLTWDVSVGATGYLVYINTGSTAPTPTLTDGAAPTGSPIANQAGVTHTEIGLTRYTEYSFTVIPYDWDGSELTTYNYGTPKTLTSVFTLETAPIVTLPTVTSITSTTAVLGGNVTDVGGNVLTERGTLWQTSSPVIITDHHEIEGGIGAGVFTDTRSSMPAKTHIFYAPFATNAVATTIGTESNFYTLANEPGIIATFTSGAQTSTSIDLSWQFSVGATGYLVYINTGSTAPTPTLTDGAAPTGSPIANQAGTTHTEIGLTRYTEYSFTVIPYDWDGSELTTYNYGTPKTLTSVFTLETAPIVTLPTVTSITSTTAVLGGNVTDVGGNVLTERGTLWQTSSPVIITDHHEIEGGTGAGVFTDTRSSMPAKTRIFYAPFATNAVATTIGTESNFYTLANEPGIIATFTSGAQTNTSIDLSWTLSAGATGYLVYINTGSTAPTPTLTDGAAPTGSPVANVAGLSTTIPALAAASEYSFTLIPYDWDGGELTTYNYGTPITLLSIYTSCLAPTTQASAISFSNILAGSVDINWTIGNGDGTLIIAKEGTVVNQAPVNGSAYTADLSFSNGDDLGSSNFVVYNGHTSGQTITNLNASTTYHFALYEFNTTDNCYYFTGAPISSVATVAPNSTSTITAGTGPTSISSIIDTDGEKVTVFTFTLTDIGDDSKSTRFSQLIFRPGTNNDIADWSQVISGVKLYDNIHPTTVYHNPAIITSNTITIPNINYTNFLGANRLGYISNGNSKTYQLKIYLKSDLGALKSTIDGQNLVFDLIESDVTYPSNFTKFAIGQNTNSDAIGAPNNAIDVAATKIDYTTQPAATAIATIPLVPQPILAARDANNNVDLDFSEAITVTTPDATLTPASALANFNSGYADFTGSGFNLQNSGSSRIRVTTAPSALVANSSPNTVVTSSTTVTELTNGIASSPLSSSSTNNALLGFNLTTTGSTINFTGGTITTSSEPDGKILNLQLYRSTDNDYATSGDNTLVGGATITTPTTSTILISGITELIDGTNANNFFIVASVEGSVNATTPTLQLSIANTSDLNVSDGNVIGSSFVGDVFSFVDVTPPTILSTTALVNPIYDGVLIQNISIIYSEPMQIGVNPTIAFTNSTDFTSGAGAWSTTTYTNDTWTQQFTHGSVNEEFTESVTVAAGILDVAGNAEASGSTSNTFVLDTKNPTATVARSVNLITQGVAIQTVTVTYDEPINAVTNPSINFGISADFTSNSDGAWSVGNTVWTESFTHGIVQEEIAVETAIVPTASGATDIVGNTDIGGVSPTFMVDTKQPKIASITSTTATGIYTSPNIVTIEINMDEPVTITGTPQITLNTTSTVAVVNYNPIGSTTTKLIFSYTIGANQNADPLDVVSMSLNGGTIIDGASNSIDLTVPLAPNRLQDNKNIEVDTKQPAITDVTSATASGFYNDFTIISIQVTFDEIVTFTGTPQISLNSGGTATYVAGAAGVTHNFTYTVSTTDNANPLDYTATNSLTLSGGTIKDLVNLDAILTLPTVNGGNSIQNDKTIVIDTDEPVVNTLTPVDDSFNYRVDGDFIIQFAEDIQVGILGEIEIVKSDSNVVVATYDMALAPAEVSFNGTDQLTINPSADLDKTTSFYITIDGTIIKDIAGNQFVGFAADTDWNFITFGPPLITSIAPETGTAVCIDANVVVNGSFLTGVTQITFEGGITASGGDVVVISDTEVHAKAPLNSLTGSIIVRKDASSGNPIAEVKTDTLAITPNTVKLGPSSAALSAGSVDNATVCSSGSTTESTIAITILGGTSNYTINYSRQNEALTITDGLIENAYVSLGNNTLGADININPAHLDQNNIYTLTTVTDNEGCSVPLAQISGSYTVKENSRAVVEAGGDASGELSYYLPDGAIITLDGSLGTPPSFFGSTGILWSNPASSNGTFDNDTNLNPNYTIGINDIFNNNVVLTLTTTGNPIACDPVSDDLLINFVAEATATPEIAGGGTVFCWDGSPSPLITLQGTVGGDATGGLWERVPGVGDPNGAGYMGFDTGTAPATTSTNLGATYLFTPFETTRGYADLTLTPTGGVGTPSAEPMILSLSLIPTINFNNLASSVCEADVTVTYSVSNNIGSSYNWTVPSTDGTTFVGQGTSTIIIDWGSGATITSSAQLISVIETNSDGCSNSKSESITVNKLPSVSFLPSQTNFTTVDTPFKLKLVSITVTDTIPLIDSSDTITFFSGQAVYKDSNNDWIFNPTLLIYDEVTPSNNDYTIDYSFTNVNGCISVGNQIFTLFNANNLITGLARSYCVYDQASIGLDPFLLTNEIDSVWRLEENGVLLTENESTSAGLTRIDSAGFKYKFRADSAGQYLNDSEERELFVRYSTYDSIKDEFNSRGQLTTVFARPSLDFDLAVLQVCSTISFVDLTPTNNISANTGTYYEFTSNRTELDAITYFFDVNDPSDKSVWKDFKLNIDNLIVQDSINGDTVNITYKYVEGNQFSTVCENTLTKKMVIYAQPFKPITPEQNNTYCVTDLSNIPTITITNQLTGFDKDGLPVEARVIWTDVLGTEVSNDPTFTPNASQLPLDENIFKITQVLYNGCESQETEVTIINFTGVEYNLINNCYDNSGVLKIGFPIGNNNEIKKLDWEIQDLQGNTIQTFLDVTSSLIIDLNVGANFEPGGYNLILNLETNSGCFSSFNQTIAVLETIPVTESSIYTEDFEANSGGWVPENVTTGSIWEYGILDGRLINTSLNGQKGWMTGLTQGYAANTHTNLYSACFDISALERPMIKIGTFYNTTADDGAVIEYTNATNLTLANWSILGEMETGDKWYNAQSITANPGNQTTQQFGWSSSTDSVWQESKHVLDDVNPGNGNVIIRVQFKSSSTNRPNFDGLAIDNVFIGNRTRTVLLENFSSTVQAENTETENNSIRDLVSNTNSLAVIQYHPDLDGDDPLSSSPATDARALYYGITTTPRAAIDGTAEPNLLFSDWGENEYGIRSLNSAPLNIVTSVVQKEKSLEINSTLTALENIPGNFIVHTAIVANKLLASNYPSDQMLSGESEFYYVVQDMLPSASGKKFETPLNKGETLLVTNNWSTSMEYMAGSYSIIIFVQDEISRNVYQTEIIEPTDNTITGLENELDKFGIAAYPNPANENITLQLKQAVNKVTKVNVYNQLGKLTYTANMATGQDKIQLEAKQWTPGIYFIQTELNGKPIRKRILVQH